MVMELLRKRVIILLLIQSQDIVFPTQLLVLVLVLVILLPLQ